jgi:hypothetical protein
MPSGTSTPTTRRHFGAGWAENSSLKTRAIHNVWKEHGSVFPNSRKRFLFVFFLMAFLVVGVGYQLWRIVGYR